VLLDNLARTRQAKPGARNLLIRGERAAEWFEDGIQRISRNANPLILYRNAHPWRRLSVWLRHGYDNVSPTRAILDGVAEQIAKDAIQAHFVTDDQ
jgi:hypothetical protein